MVCLIIIVFLFFSAKIVKTSPPAFMTWEGKHIIVTGEIYAKETYLKADKENSVVYVRLSSVSCGSDRADIRLGDYRAICYLKANQTMPKLGSIVNMSGTMQGFDKATNPGQFDAESYYQILRISFRLNQSEIQQQSHTYHKIKETLYKVQRRCSEIFDITLAPKDASVMKTMLLGEKKAVDEERKELYQKSGIAHILAISGLHISLIGMTLFKVLRRLGMPVAVCAVASTVLILLYGCMTGFPVSVIRAIGMFTIHMLARMCRRTYDMVTAVSVMAVLILSEQPLYFYSSSFLLSFGCALTIALLLPALTRKRLKEEKELKPWLAKLAGGMTVTIGILPLQMWFFYQIPLYSVLLNLLVIPLMSLLLPAGMMLLFFGSVARYPVEGILAVYDSACNITSELPGGLWVIGRPALWKAICYFGIMLIIIVWQKKLSLKKKWLFVSGAVMLLMWPSQNQCSITFLDVGQGDCIHIQSKSGNHYLIDGGSSSVSNVGEYRILPYLKYRGIRELEAVFITHPDEDHCNGIRELLLVAPDEGLGIKRLCLPDVGKTARTEAYEELVTAAERAKVPISYFSEGMSLQDDELHLKCLHPDKGYIGNNENAYSIVLLMKYETFEALFTGDVEGEGEEELIHVLQEEVQAPIDVLKVAHHGSRYSTSEEFIALTRPKVSVISCGENNSYGHPHKETLERLAEEGCAVVTTPQYGAITIEVVSKKEFSVSYEEKSEKPD